MSDQLKFNPITGQLDLVGSGVGDTPIPISVSVETDAERLALTDLPAGSICRVTGRVEKTALSGFADDVAGSENGNWFGLASFAGVIGFYLRVSGYTDTPPECDIAVAVDVAENDTAATIHAAVLNAIGTREEFAASAVPGTISVELVALGKPGASSATGGTLTATRVQEGYPEWGSNVAVDPEHLDSEEGWRQLEYRLLLDVHRHSEEAEENTGGAKTFTFSTKTADPFHACDASTGHIIIPQAGIYSVTLSPNVTAIDPGAKLSVLINVNESWVDVMEVYGSPYLQGAITLLWPLSAGDDFSVLTFYDGSISSNAVQFLRLQLHKHRGA